MQCVMFLTTLTLYYVQSVTDINDNKILKTIKIFWKNYRYGIFGISGLISAISHNHTDQNEDEFGSMIHVQ